MQRSFPEVSLIKSYHLGTKSKLPNTSVGYRKILIKISEI